MDLRLLFCFCMLKLASAQDNTPQISVKEGVLECDGQFDVSVLKGEPAPSGVYTCKKCDAFDQCAEQKITVRIRKSENLLELDVPALISVLVGDLLATAMIGWAIYSICASPTSRRSYTGNKASDKVNLINNSGGDTYERLNTRSDEYSTLHGLQGQRKHKNARNHAMSP